jgi:hypothetical protein
MTEDGTDMQEAVEKTARHLFERGLRPADQRFSHPSGVAFAQAVDARVAELRGEESTTIGGWVVSETPPT